MIIRKPVPEDFPQLFGIWQEAFGDSAEDVGNFYTTAFSCDRCLVAGDDPLGAIYWMNTIVDRKKLAYLYALAVAKDCRGQGIGKCLLKKTVETLKKEGYAGAILVPGEESLYAYYEKAGFVPFGKVRKAAVEKHAPAMPVRKVTWEEYAALRQKTEPGIEWGKEALSYLGRFCDLYAAEDCLMALGAEGVQEFLGDPEHLPHMLYTLDIDRATALLPGEGPCAMACCFENLMLPDIFCPSF